MKQIEMHAPWDDGALRPLAEVIGQRTIKTWCERRVALARTTPDEQAVTCEACKRVLAKRAAFIAELEDEARRGGRGFS